MITKSNDSATPVNQATFELRQAIISQAPFASDMAASMGKKGIEELVRLSKHLNPSVRMDALRALGALDLQNSYDIIFGALDDRDLNVVQTSLSIIERNKARLSIQILHALLDKVELMEAKNRVILMLGDAIAKQDNGQTSNPKEMQSLEKYCTIEYGESVALHSVAALAKAGSEQRRQQFSVYLLSIKHNPELLVSIFSFVDYIHQSWLLPSLGQLLQDKSLLHHLNAKLPGMPESIRVCDRAVLSVASIIKENMSFRAQAFANFTDSQLAEARELANAF